MPRVLLSLTTAVVLATGLAACSGGTDAVTEVQPAEAAKTLTAEPDITILDVRTPAEFAGGHLPGAVNIDVEGGTFDQQVAALPKDDTYLVYCHSGNRSGVATEAMAKAGFTHLLDLQGGVTAWQQAGGTLVTDGQ